MLSLHKPTTLQISTISTNTTCPRRLFLNLFEQGRVDGGSPGCLQAVYPRGDRLHQPGPGGRQALSRGTGHSDLSVSGGIGNPDFDASSPFLWSVYTNLGQEAVRHSLEVQGTQIYLCLEV